MRKIVCLLLIVFSTSFGVRAQKHVVSLNLPALAATNISLGYEYAFHDIMSVRIGASYLMGLKWPSQLEVEGISPDFSANGYAFTPEFRLYTSAVKKAPRGFYIGPYLRYGSYQSSFTYALVDPFIGDVDLVSDFKLTEMGFGLQIGLQWLIKDRVTIDWQLFGPRYGVYTLGLDVEADNALLDMDKIATDIETDFGGLPGVTPDVTTDGLKANMSVPFGLPGIRMGLCVGVAF